MSAALTLDSLVNEGTPVLRIVAKRLARRMGGGLPLDDLISMGQPALLIAAQTFDPSRSKFATYAGLKVKWAMLDGLKREGRSRSVVARATALAASERVGAAYGEAAQGDDDALQTEEVYAERLGSLLDGHAAALAMGLVSASADPPPQEAPATPEDDVARADLVRVLKDAVARLPDRERALVERHYYADEPFETIAKDLGISKSWASRVHAHAIERLGEALKGEPL